MDRKASLILLFAIVTIHFTATPMAEINFPSADVLHQKNIGFYECCSEKLGNELPGGTIRSICNYTALLGGQQPPHLDQPPSPQQTHALWKCYGDGKDHTECCKQQPELNNPDCLIICDHSLRQQAVQRCASAYEDLINQCVLDGSYND